MYHNKSTALEWSIMNFLGLRCEPPNSHLQHSENKDMYDEIYIISAGGCGAESEFSFYFVFHILTVFLPAFISLNMLRNVNLC